MLIEQLDERRLFSVSGTIGIGGLVGLIGQEPPHLSGYVFFDQNRSGDMRDRLKVADDGISGVRVYLDLDEDGRRDKKEPSTLTGDSGAYVLSGFAEEDLDATLRCVAPVGYTPTTPMAKIGDGYFGLHKPLPTRTIATSVLLARSLRTTGIGPEMSPFAGGVRVWLDLDRDGRRDKKEPQAFTYSDGRVRFNNLLTGSYVLRVSTPEGFGVDRSSITLNVADRERRNSDFTLSGTRIVAFSFYRDANGNGRRDASEALVPSANGVHVFSSKPFSMRTFASAIEPLVRMASLPRVAMTISYPRADWTQGQARLDADATMLDLPI